MGAGGAVEEELDGQTDKWIDGTASKGANEAFAEGRADGYEEHKDEISSVIYSALLDLNTCENCAAADGAGLSSSLINAARPRPKPCFFAVAMGSPHGYMPARLRPADSAAWMPAKRM